MSIYRQDLCIKFLKGINLACHLDLGTEFLKKLEMMATFLDKSISATPSTVAEPQSWTSMTWFTTISRTDPTQKQIPGQIWL
jgi:hypothetical protein